MCGIAGIFNFNKQPVDRQVLQNMLGRMLHRGPDDEGLFLDNQMGLGMRRLSIIDLATGHQPIFNEDHTVCVVMNGEIYNYVELRDQLKARGHTFNTQTDPEVIVHLYEEQGVKAIHELNGMFAFALYDKRKRALWIARDRLGIKPLYYHHNQNSLLFSSELSAITRQLSDCDIDKTALLQYLAFNYIPHDTVIFQSVKKLLPAEYLWIEDNTMTCQTYWTLDQIENKKITIQEAESQLTVLLADAVRLRLRSDVPLGVSLSGGLDSSALVAFAAQALDHPLNTFSVKFVGKEEQDPYFAQQIAKQYQTDHHEITLTPEEAVRSLDEFIPYLDEPIADSAILSSFLLAKHVKAAGIKVLLSGAGGDEIFGGYARYLSPTIGSALWFADRSPKPCQIVSQLFYRWINPDKALRMQSSPIAFGASLSGVNLAALKTLLHTPEHFEQILQLYQNDFSGINTGKVYPRMQKDLSHYLVGDILALGDKTTMAHSIEMRVPLLDHRLVEFAFGIPEAINLWQHQPKGLFRQLLTRYLPQSLIQRKKEGFNAPISVWGKDLLGQRMKTELLDHTIPLFNELFDRQRLVTLFKKAEQGDRVTMNLFNLYVFNRWYRAHVEGM